MSINTEVTFNLPIASSTQLGGVAVQASSGILVDSSGYISVDNTQFLSLSQAASTYVTPANVNSAITLALSSYTSKDIVSVIDLTLPSTWSTITNGTYNTNVTLDNTSTIFVINNPTYAIQVSNGGDGGYTNAAFDTPFINTLTLPTSVSDGHTFKITCTGPNCSVQHVILNTGGSNILTSTEGLISFNQSTYTNSNTTNVSISQGTIDATTTYVTFKIPGTYTYSESLGSWVQVA